MRKMILISCLAHAALIALLVAVRFEPARRLSGRPGFFLGYVDLTGAGSGDGKPLTAAAKLAAVRKVAPGPAQQRQQTAPQASVAQEGRGETDAASGSGPSGGGGGGGGDVVDTRYLQIRRQIEAAKVYPAVAVRRGISGVVEVRFKIDAGGQPESTEILRSSGSDLLDQATLATVRRAAPYPPVDGWISFPLRYDMILQ